jgi:hypothetical protein
MGVPERRDLLPETTHYSTISHMKKTPKRSSRNTLLPITKKCMKENKISKMKNNKEAKEVAHPENEQKNKY